MNKSKTIWAAIMAVLSSIFAFLGLIGCCGLPILAGILAWLGIGASQLSFFAAYRWWFIGFAIVALLFGFWQVYFRKNKSCCETISNSCCPGDTGKPKSQLFQKIFLWIGAVIVAAMLIIGFMGNSTTPNLPADGCCPGEEVIQDSDCCPAEEPEPVQPDVSCCPQ